MLLQRCDWQQIFPSLRPTPVLFELEQMQTRPLADETHCPWRQASFEYSRAVQRDTGPMVAVLCMEVRWWMIRPIHPDDDPIEGADPRHAGSIGLLPEPAAGQPSSNFMRGADYDRRSATSAPWATATPELA